MGRVRWVDALTAQKVTLVERHALDVAHYILNAITIHGLVPWGTRDNTLLIWLASRSNLI